MIAKHQHRRSTSSSSSTSSQSSSKETTTLKQVNLHHRRQMSATITSSSDNNNDDEHNANNAASPSKRNSVHFSSTAFSGHFTSTPDSTTTSSSVIIPRIASGCLRHFFSFATLRNEHRLIIQLVIGMVALMCQGSIYCFSLFAPTLKAEPFSFSESQINMIASLSALASFINMPAGLIYDYCGGPRPTLAIGGTLLSASWILLAYFVFNPNIFYPNYSLSDHHQHHHQSGYDDNVTISTSSSTTTTTTTTISGHAPTEIFLPLVTSLFCLVMCSATFLELGIVVGNMEAWRFHHGWLIVELKTFIGFGSSVVSLLFASEFSSSSSTEHLQQQHGDLSSTTSVIIENLQQTGNFCLFLGIFSAVSALLGALFTTAPPLPDVESSSSASSTFWDVRVIGVNALPCSSTSSSSSSSTYQQQHLETSIKLAARSRVRPMMKKGLWLLLFCFIVVTLSNAVELGVSGLPQEVYSLIGVICSLLPLLFLLLLRSFFTTPQQKKHHQHRGRSEKDQEDTDEDEQHDEDDEVAAPKRHAIPSDSNSDSKFAHGSPQAQINDSSASSLHTTTPAVIRLPGNLVPINNNSSSPVPSPTVEILKQLGNDAFAKHEYDQAVELYTQALDALDVGGGGQNSYNNKNDDHDRSNLMNDDHVRAALYSNRSASFLLLQLSGSGSADAALRDANSCIRCRPQWFKGFYRRATALMKMGKLREALSDLETASGKDPTNTEVSNAVVELKKQIAKKNQQPQPQQHQENQTSNSEVLGENADENEEEENLAKTSYKHKLVYLLEEQVGRTRRLPLKDLDDDFESELTAQAQNRDTVLRNCCGRPVDIAALWFMFFGLWGSTVMIYSNVYSIYYALQGDEYAFTSSRNAIFVSIFGVGNAAGRALAGLCVPFLQSRGRPIWTLLKVSPMLNVVGLSLFFVTRGAGLAVPFAIIGVATGFTWGSTVIFVKRVFVLVGSHYSLLYSAGGAGILCLCFGMFAFEYEKNANEQMMRQNQTASSSLSQQAHCIGVDCVRISFIVAICLNLLSMVLGEWIRYRIDIGFFDSSLRTPQEQDEENDEFVLVPESDDAASSSSRRVEEGDNNNNGEITANEYQNQLRAAFSMRHHQQQDEFDKSFSSLERSPTFRNNPTNSSSSIRGRPNLEIYNDEEMV